MAARGELCSDTATIRYLGTMPNAQSRIPTHYAPAPCGSVTRIARKDLEKYHLRDARAIRASFSLILGLEEHRPAENSKRSVTTAPTADSDLIPDQLTEAQRIAVELTKLRARGIVKDATDPEARFYSALIHQFGGTVVDAGDKTKPDDKTLDAAPVKLTAAQKVKISYGLHGKALDDCLRRDMEDAIGEGDDL